MTDMNVQTTPDTANIATDNWREWNPGLDNDELVSVWIALSPATPEGGCMRWNPLLAMSFTV